MPYSILLVDDHKILRDGIRTILERTPDFYVVGETDSGSDAVTLSRKLHPDLILMDIGLPGMNGIDATGEVLRHCPSAKVMMLSMYDDENSVVAAFRSGARAFLLKKASSSDLLDALRTVSKGGSYLSPDGLSPRERQVLRLVAEGKTSKDIAVMLDLGLQTIRTYRKTLMKKIGVSNVAGLTQVALGAGLTGWGKGEQKT